MIEYDQDKARRHKSSAPVSRFGRTSIRIYCPFCNTAVTAYVWSLAGSGKKCPGCNAIHWTTYTVPLKSKEKGTS